MSGPVKIEFEMLHAWGQGKSPTGKFYIGVLDDGLPIAIHGGNGPGSSIRTTNYGDVAKVRKRLGEKKRGEYAVDTSGMVSSRAHDRLLEESQKVYPHLDTKRAKFEDDGVSIPSANSPPQGARPRPRSGRKLAHSWI